MNCRPGDLAIVIRGTSGVTANSGRIVRVLRYYGRATFKSGATFEDCWLIEGHLEFVSGKPRCSCSEKYGADACWPDEYLRPIRDPGEDATDETLLWLPSPRETESA